MLERLLLPIVTWNWNNSMFINTNVTITERSAQSTLNQIYIVLRQVELQRKQLGTNSYALAYTFGSTITPVIIDILTSCRDPDKYFYILTTQD